MDVIKEYAPGDVIFRQGEVGNAMLVLKEGSVEVYRETPQGEVLLTVLNAGEAVGLLTFFSSGPRLASARARSHVEGQLIERKSGHDPLAKLPKWVQLVLKEFSLRLEQVDEQYGRLLHEKIELQSKVLDLVTISTQIADSLAELGALKRKQGPDGREMLFLEEMIELLQACLGYDSNVFEQIMEVFKSTGLIKVEIEQDKGLEVMSYEGAQRLKWYSEFIRSTKSGKNRRLLETLVMYKHRKVLFALREYVNLSGGDISKNFSCDLAQLAGNFQALTKVVLDQVAIELGAKVELLELKKAGEKTIISFHPANLARTLLAVNVLRRLRRGPAGELEGEETK